MTPVAMTAAASSRDSASARMGLAAAGKADAIFMGAPKARWQWATDARFSLRAGWIDRPTDSGGRAGTTSSGEFYIKRVVNDQ